MNFFEYRKRILKEYECIDGVEPPSDEQLLLTFISLIVYLKFDREETRKTYINPPRKEHKSKDDKKV